MAHLRPIDLPCQLCTKLARVRLLNRFNNEIGRYCAPCGKRKLKEQQANEDKETTLASGPKKVGAAGVDQYRPY